MWTILLLCLISSAACRVLHFQSDVHPADFDQQHLPQQLLLQGHRNSLACTDNCLALVAVHSHCDAWAHRQLWRQTVLQHMPSQMNLLFFVTNPDDLPSHKQTRQQAESDNKTEYRHVRRQWLEWEQHMNSDIVILDTTEVSSANSWPRMHKMLEWFAGPPADMYKWIAKVDQDTLLQPLALKYMLLGVPEEKWMAGRPNSQDKDWTGGPLYCIKSKVVKQMFEPEFVQKHQQDSGPDDAIATEMVLAVAKENSVEDVVCWLRSNAIHEPLTKETHWSEQFTPLSIGQHLLKEIRMFRRGFVLMSPAVAAWRACELTDFDGDKCGEWYKAFQDGAACT